MGCDTLTGAVVAVVSLVMSVGSLAILILGSACIGQNDYVPCGGHKAGALAMVIIGSVVGGLIIITMVVGFITGIIYLLLNKTTQQPQPQPQP